MTGEQWVPVAGYEGRYEVSDLGRVRSLPRTEMTPNGRRIVRGGVLTPHPNTCGYPTVTLRTGGKRRAERVHRLVAAAFVSGQNILHRCVAHLDGSRDNSRAGNLKWVSQAENLFHKRAHGTHGYGEKNGHAKLSEAQALEILEARGHARANELSAMFGISPHTVYDIWRGRRWKHLPNSIAWRRGR